MEGMATSDGRPTKAIAKLYTNLADHHVGTIITSYTYITDYEQPNKNQLGIYSDALIPDYQKVTEQVHQHGGKIVMQIVHGSSLSQGYPKKARILGPSAIPNPDSGLVPQEMTMEDIHQVTMLFADAAQRVKKAGFDGVEIHAAHGYLLLQFISPLFNHRRDAYGGSLENRFRFLDEVYQSIRQRVGADYPVWIKLISSDEEPGGLSNDDFIWMGKQLVQQGMNAIEVNGNKWQMHPFKEHAYYFDVASRLQKEVKTDIILTGGLRNREDIEKATKAGISYFGFARPFIQNIDFLKTSEK